MDKIYMKNLAFYAYHGVLEEEKNLGQKFFVDLVLYLDLKGAGQTDNIDKTVNYAEVYQLVEKIVELDQYNLLEALAENICNQVLRTFKMIEKINIKIKKPEAPVKAIFDYVAIEMTRERK